MDVDSHQSVWYARRQHLVMQPFALALTNSAVPTVLCDAVLDDYPIVFANPSFLRMTGCTEQEVLGRNIRFLNAVDADPEDVRRVEDAAVAGEVVSIDLHMTRNDGRSFWARMDSVPIFGPDGRPEMFVATLVDVSDRVRAVSGLRAAEERLERRVEERTAALESALARTDLTSRELSHRTKNALAILGALIEARRRRADDPAVAAALGEVSGQVRAMSRLQGLLERMGREEGRMALGDLVAALVDELDAASNTSVLGVRRAPDVRLDSHAALALALIVTELVLNAEKHAFRDGREGVVAVDAAEEGDVVVLTVADNGAGLPPDFHPTAGTGLGMLVVLDQVAKLQGRLETGSSLSGGALFRVIFPR